MHKVHHGCSRGLRASVLTQQPAASVWRPRGPVNSHGVLCAGREHLPLNLPAAGLWRQTASCYQVSMMLSCVSFCLVHTCSVCKPQWIQHGGECYLFRARRLGWHSSMGFCSDEFSTLAVTSDPEQMVLKHILLPALVEVSYPFRAIPWDGVLQTLLSEREGGCAYLQQGRLHAQQCNQTAFIVCHRKVQFGWP
uniref:C-type lectin domain-containing protein n=1 Tax=Salvator merianae TaxID=96440 RepID=A0A8D0C5N0_SALMN